jgi:hypothetical protein
MAVAVHKPGQHSATVKLENLGSIALVLHDIRKGAHGKDYAVFYRNSFCVGLGVVNGQDRPTGIDGLGSFLSV